jgi:hypothetical protein
MDVKDISAGQRWREEIGKEIPRADFFIPFISSNTFNKAGFIWEEIKVALDMYKRHPESGIYHIPVRLDPVEPPAAFMELQWIDVFSPDDYQKPISAINSLWERRES